MTTASGRMHGAIDDSNTVNPFTPVLPTTKSSIRWGRLYGSSPSLVISNAACQHDGPLVVITTDMPSTERLERELRFYGPNTLPVLSFPDRETLPYDVFSPHQDLVSQRLGTLYQLPSLKQGILIIPVATLMQRLLPREHLDAHTFMMDRGDRLDLDELRIRLTASGYRFVSQVMEHGEFTIRGGLIDLFPMGTSTPYRIDLIDDEIDTIRTFDPESQRSIKNVDQIRLMPALEFPLTEDAITRFRQNYRQHFEGNPQNSVIYREVSKGNAPAGIEYYLPLFFEHTNTLFDYLPDNCLIITCDGVAAAADAFRNEVDERYEMGRHDIERPILAPTEIFLTTDTIFSSLQNFPTVSLQHIKQDATPDSVNYACHRPPLLTQVNKTEHTLAPLLAFLTGFSGRSLLVAESAGRREVLLEMLHDHDQYPTAFDNWPAFIASDTRLGITVAPLDQGLLLEGPHIAVITESQLFGEQVMQRRRRRKHRERDADVIIRNLTELDVGAPVVHEEHGVGRYLGLQTLEIGGLETEFLALLYADDAKLYVPVSSLHLISRYTGATPEQAPLHRLGSEQWQKAKRKAAERARDVAAELLDLYARRSARKGHAFPASDDQYAAFAAAFPFEETPDQHEAINDVLGDMTNDKPMDRLVCGDVGFGKTEVALRAAFLAVQGGAQVAVLVPTTLLAQQHHQNFKDRFADWPVRIEVLSRFRSKKQQDEIINELETGKVDIIIGTHKLLQAGISFKQLGLVIIDEEHRFGARQKERLKALRTEVDVLTLTATPIPRTLNMSLSGLRDLSIIATPPLRRLAIKTFVREWNGTLLREVFLREIRRGGQLYFLHNEVRTIEKIASELAALIPEASIKIAHGQMRERELEQIMLDFYHQRFNVLLCTTIIESGIDVPNANTIVINRADKFGLAQLHQLRGRVGRSHHQAYAYLIAPPRNVITADAVKRLEAIESLEDLGAGFTLATHDLEIRGAGELLGEDQSGHIHEIGFSLYTELLERAVTALKSGKQPELEQPLHRGAEIDLGIPALIPEDYLADVHSRLVMYKRISNAPDNLALDELQVEMIDRFGLLPEPAKNLMRITELKLKAAQLDILKIEAGEQGGRIIFSPESGADPDKIIALVMNSPKTYKFDGENKLRFIMSMPTGIERADTVTALLEQITPN